MNKSNLLIVFLIAIVSYSCSDPAITDDLLDGNVIFDPSLYLLFMAIRPPLLSGKNLRTGQLRLLPIEFRRFYWMVTEETMGRLKLPHGKTGAQPLQKNMKN
jgi:hypothetical protein